jgi:hypothetical protein
MKLPAASGRGIIKLNKFQEIFDLVDIEKIQFPVTGERNRPGGACLSPWSTPCILEDVGTSFRSCSNQQTKERP